MEILCVSDAQREVKCKFQSVGMGIAPSAEIVCSLWATAQIKAEGQKLVRHCNFESSAATLSHEMMVERHN